LPKRSVAQLSICAKPRALPGAKDGGEHWSNCPMPY
jgi:hypothetical protein